MKASALLSVALTAAQLASYHTVGNQPFCNVSPQEKTITCNYESAEACLSNLESGQHCLVNHDYIGDLPNIPMRQGYSSSPELSNHMLTIWQTAPAVPNH